MKAIRWFYPGIGVKRWALLLAAGILVAGEGVAVASNAPILGNIENLIIRRIGAVSRGAVSPAALGLGVFVCGAGLCLYAVRRLVQSVLSAVYPHSAGTLGELLYQKHYLARGPRIVAIGGGTGLSVLLRGIKEYTANITAIVTVADDGGSSGRLRREIGMLPPGDVRNCLVALADTEPLMEALFQHRFTRGELKGHSFGNLFLAAMTEMTGDFEEAVRQSSKVLAVRGRVLPSTLENVTLCAEVEGGEIVRGETTIPRCGRKIKRVFLDPPDPPPLPEAIRAIFEADAVVIGPGSLFTSVMPNLAVPRIADALRNTRARRIYVCNVMTQPGETDGCDASAHVRAVLDALGSGAVDVAVINCGAVPEEILARYAERGAVPVAGDVELPGMLVISRDLVSRGDYARHDPARLAKTIVGLIRTGEGSHVVLP
ncbi:MAG: YvcK family protein [Firmicutes bacterium]|jgi:uncharacterized cofD-like protein|nr:YvcK family protein [Bacillota bacterium]